MIKSFKKALFLLLLLPLNVGAYSDYIIAGGQNIGIELNTNGIIVVGNYNINNSTPSLDAGIQNGDIIKKINDIPVNNIDRMLDIINTSTSDEIKITFLRNNKILNTTLKLALDDDTYKSGLYVKDSVTGVGTLTYVDPNTKIFGALGHEIILKNTSKLVDITDGNIYDSEVISINKSINGVPGEKNAKFILDSNLGTINENTYHGIFGTFNDTSDAKLYKVSKPSLGKASILTVLNKKEVEAFEIDIKEISTNSTTRNILFEITDEELLNVTGGIVQGMSGSPIIQGDNIVGAVTHVVVEKPNKGYGIFITNMLEEGEN